MRGADSLRFWHRISDASDRSYSKSLNNRFSPNAVWIRLTIIIIFYYFFFYQCPTHISRHQHWLWRKQIVGRAYLCPNRILQESEVRDLSSKYPLSKNSNSIADLFFKTHFNCTHLRRYDFFLHNFWCLSFHALYLIVCCRCKFTGNQTGKWSVQWTGHC